MLVEFILESELRARRVRPTEASHCMCPKGRCNEVICLTFHQYFSPHTHHKKNRAASVEQRSVNTEPAPNLIKLLTIFGLLKFPLKVGGVIINITPQLKILEITEIKQCLRDTVLQAYKNMHVQDVILRASVELQKKTL